MAPWIDERKKSNLLSKFSSSHSSPNTVNITLPEATAQQSDPQKSQLLVEADDIDPEETVVDKEVEDADS